MAETGSARERGPGQFYWCAPTQKVASESVIYIMNVYLGQYFNGQ